MTAIAWQVLFWLCCAILVYSYVFFPLLLPILARLFDRPPQRADIFPSVTFLVPAYNEAAVIQKKINNILSLEYPADKLFVLVGSDASTDATHTLVRGIDDARVRLWIAPQRGGKTGILNRCAPQVESDIIVFTDANTMHDKQSLARLVRSFADPAVGGVAGRIDHAAPQASPPRPQEAEVVYRDFEVRLKQNESRLHSCIAAFGGFYAIRRTLFKPIPFNAYSNDDVLIPMHVVRAGFRMVYDNEARSSEDACDTGKEEFVRRIRIGAGNFQAFFWLLTFLNPGRGWPFVCYVSHKVCRWFSPFILIGLICGACLCAWSLGGRFYTLVALGLGFSLIAATLHRTLPLRPLRQLFYFFYMNAAILLGFFRYLRGIRSAAWSRTARVQGDTE